MALFFIELSKTSWFNEAILLALEWEEKVFGEKLLKTNFTQIFDTFVAPSAWQMPGETQMEVSFLSYMPNLLLGLTIITRFLVR